MIYDGVKRCFWNTGTCIHPHNEAPGGSRRNHTCSYEHCPREDKDTVFDKKKD